MPLLQTPQGGAPQQAAPQGDTIGGEIPGSEPASQTEQDSMSQVVLAGYSVLFENEETSQQAVDALTAGADNPAQAIADYTLNLITGLDDSSGNTIPEEVILPAAAELLENVSELAKAADVFPVDEAVMNYAMELLLPPLAEEYGATMAEVEELFASVDPEIQQQMKTSQEGFARKQPPRQQGV